MKNLFDKMITYAILWFLAFVTMLAIILTAPIAWYIDRHFRQKP